MTGMIVVAAGYGSLRETLGVPVPKVIEEVDGIPMLVHPLRAAETLGITETVVVVNPRDAMIVTETIRLSMALGVLRRMPMVVVQPERHGSADAVARAIPRIRARGVQKAIITYGDMPAWTVDTYETLLIADRTVHTVTMTTVARQPEYPVLSRYGRVVRGRTVKIERIVEVTDPSATAAIIAIQHVNPSLWLWDLEWMQFAIPKVVPFKKDDGYGDERYLPPLIGIAASEGRRIGEYSLPGSRSHEALGVNTLEELQALNMSLKR